MTKFIDNAVVVIGIALIVGLLSIWPINVYKLTQCDFESDFKCEVAHGIGVIMPPASIVTVWFGTDE